MLLTEEKINELKNLISSFDIKEVKQGRTFRVVASTEDSDRSWEIIKANGWDYSNFMKNPVIIANHVYKIENIVGKATDIYVKDNQLIIEWIFSEANPLGKLLADLYDEGMVKTVSVWFIPKARDDGDKRIITNAELLELSFVAVPCNPNALSLDQKSLLENFWLLKEEAEAPSEKNLMAGGTKDSNQEEIIEKSESISNKEIVQYLADIKSLLEILVDGNTKKLSDANYIAKETMQAISRTVNTWLAAFKKSL